MATLENLDFYALSDIGFRRARNEDAHSAMSLPQFKPADGMRGFLFAVADGIGGNACGDLASRMTCRRLEAFFKTAPTGLSPLQYEKTLARIFRSIDKEVRRRSMENPGCTDMGTTLSALALFEDFGVIAHVGDSRIYRLRDAELAQLTIDHTFVQDMIAEGDLLPESAENHPLRNMLTRAVGTQEPLDEV